MRHSSDLRLLVRILSGCPREKRRPKINQKINFSRRSLLNVFGPKRRNCGNSCGGSADNCVKCSPRKTCLRENDLLFADDEGGAEEKKINPFFSGLEFIPSFLRRGFEVFILPLF